jgi:hypothetical protein
MNGRALFEMFQVGNKINIENVIDYIVNESIRKINMHLNQEIALEKQQSSKPHLDIFDFDGVITNGVIPEHDNSIIVTGRCYDESDHVFGFLYKNNILKSNGNPFPVYFNPITLEKRGTGPEKPRIISGHHKVKIAKKFIGNNVKIARIFEDDPIQYNIICDGLQGLQDCLEIIKVESDYVEKYLNDLKKKV